MRSKLVATLFLFLCAGCGGDGSLEEPSAVSTVVDTLHAVDSIGVFMGDSCYVFGAIADYTTLPGGRPAVLDWMKGTVSVFGPDGVFENAFGGFGEGPGEFQHPQKVFALSSGIIAVGELMGVMTALDSTGTFLARWTMPGMGGFPIDCAPFDDSTFVGYWFETAIEDGTALIRYSLRRYHAITGETLTEYFSWTGDPNPSTDFTPGYLVFAGDGQERIYVSMVESERWSVQVYGPDPEPLDTLLLFPERTRTALPGSGGFVPGCISARYAFSDNGGEMEMQAVNMPEEHPLISQLGVDGEGNIWCRRGGLPGDVWDVISPEGEYIREVVVTLPDSAYFIQMDVSREGILASDLFTEDHHRIYLMQ